MKIKESHELRWDFLDLGEYYRELINSKVNPMIEGNSYGGDIDHVFILLICNSGTSNYRIRKKIHTNQDGCRWIGIDCILSISKAMLLSECELRKHLLSELKLTIQSMIFFKKKIPDFNVENFIFDVCSILDNTIQSEK